MITTSFNKAISRYLSALPKGLKSSKVNKLVQSNSRMGIHTGYPPHQIYNAEPPKIVRPDFSQFYSICGGNGPQREQKQVHSGYSISKLGQTQREVTKQLEAHGVKVKTYNAPYNQPFKAALFSLCRIIQPETLKDMFELIESLNIIDSKGYLINTLENREKAVQAIEKSNGFKYMKTILKEAINGIFSRGEVIYIANNYLLLNESYAIVATYPKDLAIIRELETAHTIARLLNDGIMPILVKQPFEGVANLKLLGMHFKLAKEGKIQDYQLAFSYESTRSKRHMEEINHWNHHLGLPLIYDLIIKPKPEKKDTFYHQDTLMNFAIKKIQKNDKVLNFEGLTTTHIFDLFKPSGICFMTQNGPDRYSLKVSERIFENVISLDPKNDGLISNLVITVNDQGDYVLLVSDELTSEDEKKITNLGVKVIKKENKSFGGGGSHQCMKNVYAQGPSISVSQWRDFLFQQREMMTDEQRKETAVIPHEMLFHAVELILRDMK